MIKLELVDGNKVILSASDINDWDIARLTDCFNQMVRRLRGNYTYQNNQFILTFVIEEYCSQFVSLFNEKALSDHVSPGDINMIVRKISPPRLEKYKLIQRI